MLKVLIATAPLLLGAASAFATEPSIPAQNVLNKKTLSAFYAEMDARLPYWHKVNKDPAFVNWLKGSDDGNSTRGEYLTLAFTLRDVDTTLKYFALFLENKTAQEYTSENAASVDSTCASHCKLMPPTISCINSAAAFAVSEYSKSRGASVDALTNLANTRGCAFVTHTVNIRVLRPSKNYQTIVEYEVLGAGITGWTESAAIRIE